MPADILISLHEVAVAGSLERAISIARQTSKAKVRLGSFIWEQIENDRDRDAAVALVEGLSKYPPDYEADWTRYIGYFRDQHARLGDIVKAFDAQNLNV